MKTDNPFLLHSFDDDVFALYSIKRLDFRRDKNNNSGFTNAYNLLCDFVLDRCSFSIREKGLFFPEQVHGNKVVNIKPKDCSAKRVNGLLYILPGSDGLITSLANTAIAVLSADCLPIFIYDAVNKAVGIIHAGWKGTHLNIAQYAVEAMVKEFKSDPKMLKVLFGPSIRSCCYRIDKDRAALFQGHVHSKDAEYFLDIASANISRLKQKGVPEDSFTDCNICTSCDNKDFFSYRREGGNCGRMISLIFRK